jgi:hypothetical protein
VPGSKHPTHSLQEGPFLLDGIGSISHPGDVAVWADQHRDGGAYRAEHRQPTWKIAGTGLHMRAGETLRMTFTKK